MTVLPVVFVTGLAVIALALVTLTAHVSTDTRTRANLAMAETSPTTRPDTMGTGSTAATGLLDRPSTDAGDPPTGEDDPARGEGVTRRRFLNRATFAVFGLVVGQFALLSLSFMWPRLRGGFGTRFNAGKVAALKAEVLQGSTVVPKAIPAAQAWIVPMPLDRLPGSSYETLTTVVTGGEDDGIGLMALWHRCPHLGCRVPECVPSQGFECPCHGSKFNIHGEYAAGPAPRNMDRFAVTTSDAGELIIDTGTIIQTSRSQTYTSPYPQGPFCV